MLVFVYGTLMRGFYNHGVMKASRGQFITNVITERNYDLISLGAYPGMIFNPKDKNFIIKGELYDVPELHNLDRLEGYPSLYDRHQIPVIITHKPDFAKVNAWAYFIRTPDFQQFNSENRGVGLSGNVKYWFDLSVKPPEIGDIKNA